MWWRQTNKKRVVLTDHKFWRRLGCNLTYPMAFAVCYLEYAAQPSSLSAPDFLSANSDFLDKWRQQLWLILWRALGASLHFGCHIIVIYVFKLATFSWIWFTWIIGDSYMTQPHQNSNSSRAKTLAIKNEADKNKLATSTHMLLITSLIVVAGITLAQFVI